MVAWTRTHPTLTFLLSGLLVALIGSTDYVTGHAFSFAALYLLPVVLITWGLGRDAGFRIGTACAITGAGADVLAGRSAGHALWELTTNGMIFGTIIVVFGELQHALEQVQRMAQHDPLTGLANRGAFYEQAAGELVRCQRYGHPLKTWLAQMMRSGISIGVVEQLVANR